MKLFDRVKNWFRKGGAAIGMIETLSKVTDHPKINIDAREYQRIREAMTFYKGNFPQEEYTNSKGDTKKRDFFDIGMTETLAGYLAGLVFNEQCEIVVSPIDAVSEVEVTTETGEKIKKETIKATNVADEFIQGVIADNDFKKNFAKYLQPMFGLGGIAVRPYVDSKTKKMKFNWALADAFYPLKNNTNNISEGAFVSTTTIQESKDLTVYYTLIEIHEWLDNGNYQISNELYRSEKRSEVGIKVPLASLYENMRETTEFQGLTRPLFAYLKPAGFNNINPYSPLGLGVVDNAKKVLEQINRTNNQMEWEMFKAKPRLAATDHYFKTKPAKNGIGFDLKFDDESEEFLLLRGDMDKQIIQDITLGFNPKPYVDKINYHFRMLEIKSRLSVGTFSFDGKEGIKTATEVVSEDSDTFRNRNEQISEIEHFLKELIITMCELGKCKVFGIYTGPIPTHEDIGIDFDDGIFTDKNAQLEYYGKAKVFGFIPDVEAIQRVFKVPTETAQKWVTVMEQQKRRESNINESELDRLEKEKYPVEY